MQKHLCRIFEGFRVLGRSVQPLQLYVSTRYVDRQLFLQCGGEAAMLAVPLDLLRLLWFSGLRSIGFAIG